MASSSHALQMGILGAIGGALKFQLDENTRQRAEEAELLKAQRLEQIQIERENRDNAEWERRTEIDQANQIESEERQLDRQLTVQDDQQEFQSSQGAVDRSFERETMAEEEAARLREIDAREQARMEEVRLREKLRRSRPQAPGSTKGIQGDDGKFYPAGTPIPQGVKPIAGYGTTWAPSDSKTDAPGRGRRTRRSAPSVNAPAGAITMLRQNPALADQFDAKYGEGAAAQVLGQ